MTSVTNPTVDGVYRIRVCKNDRYMDLAPDGSHVKVSPLDTAVQSQMWIITAVEQNVYKIKNAADGSFLTYANGGDLDRYKKGYLKAQPKGEGKGQPEAATLWKVEPGELSSRITVTDASLVGQVFVDSCDRKTAHFWSSNPSGVDQNWVFERLSVVPHTGTKNFQNSFFKLTVKEAAKPARPYDIIVIGTGIGGGVLAGSLFETNSKTGCRAKNILVIEKGDLVFHSHCLNTARPTGLANDRGQQNDTFFAKFKEDYTFSDDTNTKDWHGGPMYCLGGRSAAWGLFSPRIHDSTLKNRFPKKVCDDLWSKWYAKAEKLFMLSLPETKTVHRHNMERLNMAAQQLTLNLDVQWQWGRIASEFRDERNFDFAEGAYSTIDKLLEIAMSKPKIREVVSDDGKAQVTRDWELEHENFKMLINAEARRLKVDKATKKFEGVWVRDASGEEHLIEGKEVVLAAGSVDSPTILLRSELDLPRSVGKLTDHDILYWSAPFRYTKPGRREEVGSMKLQTYVNLGGNNIALGNMSVDASSFLPRGESPDEDIPKFIMVFILQNPLVQDSSITLDKNGQPVVKIVRYIHDDERAQISRMQELTYTSVKSMKETLGLEFIGEPSNPHQIEFKYLELGGVAHELGTLPMPNKNKDNAYCVDEDLKLASGYEGIYVCDLSVFPYSPEANPTLTLAALSLRLSRYLTRDTYFEKKDGDTVSVVNRTGRKIQVWLSNRANAPNDERGYTIMGPGDLKEWTRVNGKPESLFVFKLDQTAKEGEVKFLAEPVLLVAHPGAVTAIY